MEHVFAGRLYVPAVDAVAVRLEHRLSQGWTVVVAHRHSGEPWEHCASDEYHGLASSELPGLLDAVVSELVGWSVVETP